MKMNRLFEIVYILLEKKQVTATELAEHFEVSTRTIYRDIDMLSLSGIPIYATKGKGGGIRLLEHFTMDRTIVNEQEQQDILASLNSLQQIGALDDETTIQKLSAMFKKQPDDWIQVDFSDWSNAKEGREKFQKIRMAILRHNLLQIEYYNRNGQSTKRILEPYQLVFKGQAWYVYGYCRLREDWRFFKINRMRHMEVLEEAFLIRTLPEKSIEQDRIETVTLKLIIDKAMAYRVYDEFPVECVTKRKDGSFYVEISYPVGEWVIGTLLSYGSALSVLEPENVKETLRKEYRRCLEHLENKQGNRETS